MGEVVICLACGGVAEGTPGTDEHLCTCPPPTEEAQAIDCPHCGGRLRIGVRACPFCRSSVGTTRCSHCLAWNTAEATCCHGCGRDLGSAAAEEVGSTPLLCPTCQSRLVTRRYADWDVDECDDCGGVFVESSTLDSLLHTRQAIPHGLRLALPKPVASARAPHPPGQMYLKCPVCRTLMTRRNFGRISGVLIDVCNGHGVWFDSGELSDVLAFVARGGWDGPRARRRTYAVPEGAPKGSFGDKLELTSYDGVAASFWDALEAIWDGIGEGSD